MVKKLDVLIGIAFVLLIFSLILFLNSIYERQRWEQSIKGVMEIGSVTYKDYEVLDKDFFCEICEGFYCGKGDSSGCKLCIEKCYPIKSFFNKLKWW